MKKSKAMVVTMLLGVSMDLGLSNVSASAKGTDNDYYTPFQYYKPDLDKNGNTPTYYMLTNNRVWKRDFKYAFNDWNKQFKKIILNLDLDIILILQRRPKKQHIRLSR